MPSLSNSILHAEYLFKFLVSLYHLLNDKEWNETLQQSNVKKMNIQNANDVSLDENLEGPITASHLKAVKMSEAVGVLRVKSSEF